MKTVSNRLMIDFRDLKITEVIALGRYHYAEAHLPLKPHRHQRIFEFSLLESGTQTYYIGPTRYDLFSGDLLITKPGEVHGTGAESENKGWLYWLQLGQLGPECSFPGLTNGETQELMQRLLRLPARHLHNGHALTATFEQILNAYAERQDSLRAAQTRNLLLRLVLDVLSLAEHQQAQPRCREVDRAIRHIEKHFDKPLTVTQLARAAGMSESHFKVVFKRETGLPPIEYYQWYRVEHAKHLLRATTRTITQVAMDGGFATSQHFATLFKRLTGFTPRAFRRQSRLPESTPPVSGAGPRFHPVLQPQ